MKSLSLDHTGDLVMKNNDLVLFTGEEELMQTIKTLLKTNLNEWFLDPEQGLDYSVIFTKEVDEDAISFAIKEAMDQLEEIDRVDEIDIIFNAEKRHLDVSFIAITIEGDELEVREVL